MSKNVFFVVVFHISFLFLSSQCYWVNNGANVIISNNSKVIVLGEYQNLNSGYTTLENNYDSLYVKQMLNNATLNSNGAIFVDTGNWINNSTFTANNSRTYVRGVNQEITGTSPTTFYDLYLIGPQTSGQKKLGNNITVQNKMYLNANDIFLQNYTLLLNNPSTTSLDYVNGYISSNDNGKFVRATNTTQAYYFPMGSENLPFRFRPINVTPSTTTNNLVGVNFRNYNATNYGYDPSIRENILCQVNDQFFYRIERTNNTAPFNVQIFYDEAQDGVWETMAKWSTTPAPTEWKEQTPSTYQSGNPFSNVTATVVGSTSQNENIVTLAKKAILVNLGNDTALCGSSGLTLNAGNPGLQYSWSTGASTPQITVTTTGIYGVTVTNPQTNCTGSDQISVQFIALPVVNLGNDTTICQGSSVVLNAGNPGHQYSWSNGYSTQQITVTTTGTYSVTVTYPQSSCSGTDEIYVQVDPLPVVNLGNDTTICDGTSLTLDAGNPGHQYAWSTNVYTQQIQVSSAGTYSVTVTNPVNNCSNSDQITIQIQSLPNAQITSNLQPLCQNDPNPTLQASPAGGTWSGQGINPSTGTINLSSLSPGQYIIYYTVSNVCGSDKDSTQIIVKEVPAIQIFSNPETCIGANDGKAWVTIQGNDVPYTIIWSNNQTTDTISSLVPGTYHVQVTGANGCKTSSNTTVTAGTDECYITHIFIPNIFSPNGDGNNDVFQVYGAGIQSIKIYIYDRWGIKIFEGSSLTDSWDGTYKGKPLDPAVFTYYITVQFKNGETKEFEGTLSLIK